MIKQPFLVDKMSPLTAKATLSMREGNNEGGQNEATNVDNNEVAEDATAEAKSNANAISIDKTDESENATAINPTNADQLAATTDQLATKTNDATKEPVVIIDLMDSPKKKSAKATQTK